MSSCKVSQPMATVLKASVAPETKLTDSAFVAGNLLGDSVGDDLAEGFGLSGTGQGGGGVSEFGAIGLGNMNMGYGDGGKKKKSNDSKQSDRNSSEKNKKDKNGLANESGLQSKAVQGKVSDQTKVDKLIGFKDSPQRAISSDEIQRIRKETYRMGAHPKEMPAGSYAVAESFDTEEAANLFAARLVRLGFDPNVPRYVSANNKWYVCMDGPGRPSKTREKISELSALEIFKGMWQVVVE